MEENTPYASFFPAFLRVRRSSARIARSTSRPIAGPRLDRTSRARADRDQGVAQRHRAVASRAVDLGGGHVQAHGPERLLQLLHGGDRPGAEAAEDARVQRSHARVEEEGC